MKKILSVIVLVIPVIALAGDTSNRECTVAFNNHTETPVKIAFQNPRNATFLWVSAQANEETTLTSACDSDEIRSITVTPSDLSQGGAPTGNSVASEQFPEHTTLKDIATITFGENNNLTIERA